MRIIFHTDYKTHWGQMIYITGKSGALGDNNPEKAIPMQYGENGIWSADIKFPGKEKEIEYSYFIREGDAITAADNGKIRFFIPDPGYDAYEVFDYVPVKSYGKYLSSSAFTKTIFARTEEPGASGIQNTGSLKFSIYAPDITPDEILAISGNIPALGEWDTNRALKLISGTSFPYWSIETDASLFPHTFEYKFVILNKKTNELICWEEGPNRWFEQTDADNSKQTIISLTPNFQKLEWKGAGVAIPVFSLRSEDSFGIGEFNDIKILSDWASLCGMKAIQILPVNDTTSNHTWTDSYPYNAISIFALHPIYLNPFSLGNLKNKKEMSRFKQLQIELNQAADIDYAAVENAKWEYFRTIFSEKGEKERQRKEYIAFFNKNKEWLLPYAVFCYLRDKYKTSDFRKWKKYDRYIPEEIEKLCNPSNSFHDEIAIHYYLQYHLYKQLSGARQYAQKSGIILKGDIPIGINCNSVEAWSENRLFNMESQAGAPPDDFSVSGQNWGFPTYNWDRMKKDNYDWWKKRFKNMALFFNAYRIDHILGFFRIWEIPEKSVRGLLGYFNPALPLSHSEIETYGYFFDEEKDTMPVTYSYFLPQLFSEYTDFACYTFLENFRDDEYTLKPEFDSQRKIEDYFSGKNDEMNLLIKEGLFSLTEEVLFIRDPYEPKRFHPRISAQNTFRYKTLNDYEKNCFDRLYVDYYYYRHNEFWKKEALKKLPPLLSSTDMLVCGEDLGMIPHSVPEVMNQLQILSLEIQRMPKTANGPFADTKQYPYLSVCSTSTHDMPTLREWWEEDREKTQYFFNFILNEPGEAPINCEPWICEKIIDLHLSSPSMLAILPLQDWLSMDGKIRRKDFTEERINIPSVPRYYWRYRMHLKLEELIKNHSFSETIKNHLRSADR